MPKWLRRSGTPSERFSAFSGFWKNVDILTVSAYSRYAPAITTQERACLLLALHPALSTFVHSDSLSTGFFPACRPYHENTKIACSCLPVRQGSQAPPAARASPAPLMHASMTRFSPFTFAT